MNKSFADMSKTWEGGWSNAWETESFSRLHEEASQRHSLRF